jgi:hypothetical protein
MKERSQWSTRSPEECDRSDAQLVDQQRNSREPKTLGKNIQSNS